MAPKITIKETPALQKKFVDGVLVGTTAPGETVFYHPAPGKYRVVCEDDHGRSSRPAITGNCKRVSRQRGDP